MGSIDQVLRLKLTSNIVASFFSGMPCINMSCFVSLHIVLCCSNHSLYVNYLYQSVVIKLSSVGYHLIHTVLVTYLLTLNYWSTNYISPLDATPTKLHVYYWCHTYLIMEGYVACPLLVPYPPDYGRTSYMSPHAATPTWLWKDKLHILSPWFTCLFICTFLLFMHLGQIWPHLSSC